MSTSKLSISILGVGAMASGVSGSFAKMFAAAAKSEERAERDFWREHDGVAAHRFAIEQCGITAADIRSIEWPAGIVHLLNRRSIDMRTRGWPTGYRNNTGTDSGDS